MAEVLPINFNHRLRCHVCKGNIFEITLDSDLVVQGKIKAIKAICANPDCEQGCLDLTKDNEYRARVENE